MYTEYDRFWNVNKYQARYKKTVIYHVVNANVATGVACPRHRFSRNSRGNRRAESPRAERGALRK